MSWDLSEYELVEDRIRKFWADYPDGRITTSLLEHSESRYIVQAHAWRTGTQKYGPDASGLAEETVGSTPVNKTSALENCETSAIGRALANLGYAAKGKRPSREEMDKPARSKSSRPSTGNERVCPDCGDGVWDNRVENDARELRGEIRRPDLKCRKCEWIQWTADTPVRDEPELRDDIPAPILADEWDELAAPF